MTKASQNNKQKHPQISPFLLSISKKLTSEGESFEIEGQEFYVVMVDMGQNGRLLMHAESLAKESLRDRETELKNQKLTAQEKKETIQAFIAQVESEKEKGQLLVALNKMRSMYEIHLYLEKLTIYGDLFMVESIRNVDGSRIYGCNKERQDIISMLSAHPQAKEDILKKIQIVQKKSSPKNA